VSTDLIHWIVAQREPGRVLVHLQPLDFQQEKQCVQSVTWIDSLLPSSTDRKQDMTLKPKNLVGILDLKGQASF
jgi:hypothetical protein